jgi:hypothetical protein
MPELKKGPAKKDPYKIVKCPQKAKKSWRIVHNQYDIKIVKDEMVGEIPELFLAALKAEKVI